MSPMAEIIWARRHVHGSLRAKCWTGALSTSMVRRHWLYWEVTPMASLPGLLPPGFAGAGLPLELVCVGNLRWVEGFLRGCLWDHRKPASIFGSVLVSVGDNDPCGWQLYLLPWLECMRARGIARTRAYGELPAFCQPRERCLSNRNAQCGALGMC